MYLCSDNHDEICHEGRQCPLCATIKEKDQEIESLNDKFENLQSKVGELESREGLV